LGGCGGASRGLADPRRRIHARALVGHPISGNLIQDSLQEENNGGRNRTTSSKTGAACSAISRVIPGVLMLAAVGYAASYSSATWDLRGKRIIGHSQYEYVLWAILIGLAISTP